MDTGIISKLVRRQPIRMSQGQLVGKLKNGEPQIKKPALNALNELTLLTSLQTWGPLSGVAH
jgi:hypothetical protein